MITYFEQSVNQTEANLPAGLRRCNYWKNLATVLLQALPISSDAKVHPILQAVEAVETTKKSKQGVYYIVFK